MITQWHCDDYEEDDDDEIVDLQDPKSLQLLAGLVEAAMKSPLRGENFCLTIMMMTMTMVVMMILMVMMTKLENWEKPSMPHPLASWLPTHWHVSI